jgi:hypothetical protein
LGKGGKILSSNDVAGKFLKSIDKYARQQQLKIEEEIQNIEKAELEKSESRIIEDVNNMIQKELVSMKNKISVDISHKELECRKNLAGKRQNMLNEMFDTCAKELMEYTKTSEYTEKMKEYAKDISKVLSESDTKLFVKEEDLKYSNLVKESFGRNCEICSDENIQIGGIRGYSEKLGIMGDETLDSSLEKQKDWFIQEYGSKLVY